MRSVLTMLTQAPYWLWNKEMGVLWTSHSCRAPNQYIVRQTSSCAIKLEEDLLFDAFESHPLYPLSFARDRNIAPTTLTSNLFSSSVQLSRYFSCVVVDRTLDSGARGCFQVLALSLQLWRIFQPLHSLSMLDVLFRAVIRLCTISPCYLFCKFMVRRECKWIGMMISHAYHLSGGRMTSRLISLSNYTLSLMRMLLFSFQKENSLSENNIGTPSLL